METPFVDVSVLPMYGEHMSRIAWRVVPGYEKGKYIIYRSPDGLNNWTEIGKVSGVLGSFVDTTLVPRGRLDEAYYKIILQYNGKRYDSEIVSTFGKINRREFGASRVIMQHEWLSLRLFTPIKFFKLRTDGPVCTRCVDPDTGQKIGISLCQVCYGTAFEGGYYPAVDAFMHIGEISPKIQDASREGTGAADPVTVHARMAAYPLMEKEDMIVNPAADRRYLVETVNYGWLNGKIPVYAEAQLMMLARNNIRYTFPLK